jgi:hypothetical protein
MITGSAYPRVRLLGILYETTPIPLPAAAGGDARRFAVGVGCWNRVSGASGAANATNGAATTGACGRVGASGASGATSARTYSAATSSAKY